MRVTIFAVLALFGCLVGVGVKPRQPAPANVQAPKAAPPTEHNSDVEWLVRTNPPDLEARLNPGWEPVQPAPATRPPRKPMTEPAKPADNRQHRELVKQRERHHREHMKRLDDIKRHQQQIEWYLLRKHGR